MCHPVIIDLLFVCMHTLLSKSVGNFCIISVLHYWECWDWNQSAWWFGRVKFRWFNIYSTVAVMVAIISLLCRWVDCTWLCHPRDMEYKYDCSLDKLVWTCSYSLRKRQHGYQLPHIEYNLYKTSFINRCLFNFRWLLFSVLHILYPLLRPILYHYLTT